MVLVLADVPVEKNAVPVGVLLFFLVLVSVSVSFSISEEISVGYGAVAVLDLLRGCLLVMESLLEAPVTLGRDMVP